MPRSPRKPVKRVPSTRTQLIRVVWLALAVALAVQSRGGADYNRYAQWPKAFASSDILKIGSAGLSPVGVPMTHWSHAPGLIADAIARTLSLLPSVKVDLHTAAWLTAMAFWWALIGLVRMATRRDPVWFVFALGAAFIGTHAGLYSFYHSSEIFSLATFAVATYWALSAGPERLRDSLIVGVVCGLLLTVRVNLAMYVVLPIATRAVVVFRGNRNRIDKALVFHALSLGVPLLMYCAQLLFFNYWATGSPTRSPYVYGDENFRSVDFAHPMFFTMLFHAWHGLLTYHPLFALGPIALLALTVRRESPLNERIFTGYALFALLAQFYVQASWWCWWNGTGTFGNRSLAVGSTVVVVALARWLFLLTQSATRRSLTTAIVVLLVSAACCVWSLLLYVQGHSNYVTWRELLHWQRQLLLDPDIYAPVCVAALLSLGFALVAFRRLRMRAVHIAISAFVATVALQGLYSELVRGWLMAHELQAHSSTWLAAGNALAFALIVYLITGRHAIPGPVALARTAVAGGLLCVFVVGSWSFVELAVATKSVIANATAKPRSYHWRAPITIDDLVGCMPEYERVEGFTAEKAAFKHFIDAAASEARRSIKDPTPSQPRPL